MTVRSCDRIFEINCKCHACVSSTLCSCYAFSASTSVLNCSYRPTQSRVNLRALSSIPCCTPQSHANRYKRHIVPMLSLSVDFYVRVFVRVYTSPAAVKDSSSRLMYVYQSQGCDSFYPQKVGRKVCVAPQLTYIGYLCMVQLQPASKACKA